MTIATTFSGRALDLLDPQPDQIDIHDIARALSQINRFNGNTRFPYSVGLHSIMAADAMMSIGHTPQARLAALMHDAAEAYVGDISTPVKDLLGDNFRDIERHVSAVIYRKFGVDEVLVYSDTMRDVDRTLANAERSLLIEDAAHWPRGHATQTSMHGARCRAVEDELSPGAVRVLFLSRFQELRLALGMPAL